MRFHLPSVIRIIVSGGIGFYAILCAQYAFPLVKELVKELISPNPHEMMVVTFRSRELTGTALWIYAGVFSLIPIILLAAAILIWPKSAPSE